MTLVTNQQPIVAFPADVWEKAESKEELADWLNKYSQEAEISPILRMKDNLTIGKKEILIEFDDYDYLVSRQEALGEVLSAQLHITFDVKLN